MDSGTILLACLLSALPGPPGVSIEDAFVQLFPVDKTKCPTIDPVRDITYLLYTSENPLQPDVLSLNNDAQLKNSHFDFNKPTVLFFHAFFETYTSAPATTIKTAYLQRKDHNIILLDAQRMEAGPWYITAARNTRVVGEYTAAFIDYLVSRGLILDSLHLIGLSLGAQMAGVCGQNIKSGRIRRITGLDPAGPLFTKWPRSLKLDKADAEFVDIIHTDAGIFGYPFTIGHADFWPNSGLAPQPGCTIGEIKQRNPDTLLELAFCSHWRSYMFFSESVVTPRSFASTVCKNWKAFANKECDANGATEYMGFGVSSRARGNYYLYTREKSPFSLQTQPPQAAVSTKNIGETLFSNVIPYERSNHVVPQRQQQKIPNRVINDVYYFDQPQFSTQKDQNLLIQEQNRVVLLEPQENQAVHYSQSTYQGQKLVELQENQHQQEFLEVPHGTQVHANQKDQNLLIRDQNQVVLVKPQENQAVHYSELTYQSQKQVEPQQNHHQQEFLEVPHGAQVHANQEPLNHQQVFLQNYEEINENYQKSDELVERNPQFWEPLKRSSAHQVPLPRGPHKYLVPPPPHSQ